MSLTLPGPEALPQLHVIEVASQAIPEGTVPPTTFVLPTGTPAEQTVTVQAQDFQGLVDAVKRFRRSL